MIGGWIMTSNGIIAFFTTSFLTALAMTGCSDLRNPVPTNPAAETEVHPEGWLNVDSQNFHGRFLQGIGWDLRSCQQCHGTDYRGGIADVSCLTCHPATPEDCVVCHGGVDNLTGAPPEDLAGNRAEGAVGVGAHSAHLTGEEFSDGIECESCHLVPDSFYATGHVDSDLPAEVTFSNLTLADSANPTWQRNAATCANAYCHGNWSLAKSQSNFSFIYTAEQIEGNAAMPTWTDAATVVCGTCHDLPPKGHTPFQLTECTNCHSSVVDADGNIADKSKHVNGMVNVFGQEFPVF